MARSNHNNFNHQDDLQPRPKRKQKRKSSDRGLPSDSDLRMLAAAYLEAQHHFWPELVKSGVLPTLNEAVLDQMVESYKSVHQTRILDADGTRAQLQKSVKLLAAAYARYSCDNSSPTSIVDQILNALRKAKNEGRFIPWAFVFTDYAVSGLDSTRRGYLNCKSLIDHPKKVINSVYIDDFSRASRDAIEWWKLAFFCKYASVRMIGASDGFDLSSESWDIQITIYGLVSRLYVKSLQQKVGRGMRRAAREEASLGKPPMGFTRKLKRDKHGNPIITAKGKPRFEWVVDPKSKTSVELLFELFVDKRLSAYKIHKLFNQQKIDGTDTWTESSIKKMLMNPAYVGIFIWNRTRREFNFETEKWEKVPNPMTEWIVSFKPRKAIIPVEKWRAARRLLKSRQRRKNPNAFKSRNQLQASTLFSGTLVCSYCGRELLLYRSAGKYKNMFCPNGRGEIYSCQLGTSKSTRVIENCLLAFLRESVLTEAAVTELVTMANEHLKTLASKPTVDVRPIESAIARHQKQIDRLVLQVANLDDSKRDLQDGYERNILKLQKEVTSLRKQLHDAEQTNSPVPPRLTKKRVETYLAALREVLNQEIPMAAEAIRQLTGPISIRQEPIPGKKRGARWIATFSPNLLALLHQIAKDKDYPDSLTLEYLSHGIWTMPVEVSTVIDEVPKYERLAPIFKEMRDNGASIQTIAAAHGLCWDQAKNDPALRRHR